MTVPDVSIVLCTYNGEKYLPELLDSLLEQTLLPSELVWRDDQSTDRTVEIASDFAQRAPFPVDFAINPQNLGPIQNFGQAMSNVKGSHIALCDQDDVWLPRKLEQLAGPFTRPGTTLAYSNSFLVDGDLNCSDQTFLEQRGTQHFKKDTLPYLLFQNTVSGCVSMFPSDLLPTVLPIPNAAIMHDWWIALVAAAEGQITHIPDVTVLYRQHTANVLGAPPRFTMASYRASGLPFSLWRKAGNKFAISANQAIALQRRLEQREIQIPESLSGLVENLGHSKLGLWRACRQFDIQRGDWIRNLYFAAGLLAHRKSDLTFID